ncbi:MAG TPA: cell wall-binding repeat-containing protein, partial [Desulfosporosinus sp.]|nr:cell wall-binding repeat-containing protein [Desulfosporosinus sp.]
VTFTGGTETTGTAPNQGVTAASGTFVLPANPFIKTGYTFTGWNDGTTTYAAGVTYTMPANAVTLTAQWTANASNTHTVNGTIKDTNGNPVSSATVTLTDITDSTKKYTGTTDADGNYSIPGVPDESYTVTVTKGSVTLGSGSVTVNGGDVTGGGGNITVTPPTPPSDPTHTVTGTIKDTNNNPVSGGTVTLTDTKDSSKTYTGTTNGNGNYSISGVPDESYTVTVTKGSETLGSGSVTVNGGDVTGGGGDITVISPTYTVIGNVKDEETNAVVDGATLKLMAGSRLVAQASTDGNGDFSISGIPNGTYNLVISKGYQVITRTITVSDDITTGSITLPKGNKNSVVEVKDNTPDIIVDKLNDFFNSDKFTLVDRNVVVAGGTVEIKLVVEKKSESAATNADSIKSAAGSGKTIGMFLDLTVNKIVTPSGSTTEQPTLVTELADVLIIDIPLPAELQGKSNYVIYRYHGAGVQTITPTINADGEYIELSADGKSIKLYTKKFSTYAIAYTAASTPSTGGGGGSGGGSSGGGTTTVPTNTSDSSTGGKVTISTDKKTATIIPDDGYIISDVLVDGKSVGATSTYTFTDSENHTIKAVFVKETGVNRLAGENSVDTALEIAKAGYKGKLSNVVLATAQTYPDALAGSVLAYKLNAPILLVGSTETDQKKVLDYLETNLDSAGTVYILGGTAVVSSAMEANVTAIGCKSIIRLGGVDRYETAMKIADHLELTTGTSLVLVNGESYPDALSISSMAGIMQSPILLIQKDGISEEVKEKIAEIQPEKVYIIGLEGVISTVAEREVARITTLTQESIIRIGGFDRYETSLAVAQYFNLSGQSICIATGNNFPDALAGSVYAANFKAPIILVNGSLSEMQINYLKTRKITGATIFGGAAVISNDLEQQLGQLIEK